MQAGTHWYVCMHCVIVVCARAIVCAGVWYVPAEYLPGLARVLGGRTMGLRHTALSVRLTDGMASWTR